MAEYIADKFEIHFESNEKKYIGAVSSAESDTGTFFIISFWPEYSEEQSVHIEIQNANDEGSGNWAKRKSFDNMDNVSENIIQSIGEKIEEYYK